MTKRNQNFDNKSNKKQKLNDDIEALWGDDIDESALDDCCKLATQVFEGEKLTCNTSLNISRLPTYNVFKEPQKIFSSTQYEGVISTQPSTSKGIPLSNKENQDKYLEKEIEELRVRCQEKEGEATILRTQLKETQATLVVEQQRVQNEWKKKFVISEKQSQSVKSDLEFKTLEIANLKQQLLDVTRKSLNTTFTSQSVANAMAKKGKNKTGEPAKREQCRLYPLSAPSYPLKGIDIENMFGFVNSEKYVIETKRIHSCRNVIPYLQNQNTFTRILLNNSCVNFKDLSPVMFKLVNSTKEALNLAETIATIDKIICVVYQLLEDLYRLLDDIKGNSRTEDVLEADTVYVRKQVEESLTRSSREDSIGINAGIVLSFLAELLPSSDYLQKILCRNLTVDFRKHECFNARFVARSRTVSGQQLLERILDILKVIGEIRKADLTLSFLLSVVKLLSNVCKSGNYDYINGIFCQFANQLIFLRPEPPVVFEMTSLFKMASVHHSFVEFLFNKAKNCSTTKNGVVYFNEDACRFYIFVLIFHRCLYRLENVPFEVCLNMLCFIYNSYKTSCWVHQQDAKDCECLSHLYKIVVELIYRVLQKFLRLKRTRRKNSQWEYFFKNKVVLKILSLMTFHSYEFIEKDITVFSQYKEIEQYLSVDEDLTDLERLNISEEIPEIPSRSFDNVDF